jgi:phenylacetic acid degradation operon negative regulatory protein
MSDFLNVTRSLVQRFRRQRPIRSGSLLVTILGDSIAPRGGVVTLGSLIRLAQPFGLTERLVRTSVARLAQDGWLVSAKTGRQSEYRLTQQGERRFAEATQRIYSAGPHSWDGTWTVLLLPPVSRAQREHIRGQMRWLGFGQLNPGALAHPSRSLDDTRSQLADLKIQDEVILMRASSEGPAHDRRLVEAGWDLAGLSRGYKRFVEGFSAIREALREGSAQPPAETAFLVRTLLIHEYRKIHLRDPLLPPSLLPAGWIGLRAYELCRESYRTVFAAAESFVSAHAETVNGSLPPLSGHTFTRFGGLPGAPRATQTAQRTGKALAEPLASS